MIGVQMMMLREKIEEIGIYETLKLTSELGYKAYEISQIPMTPENVAEIKRAKEDFDLDIASISANVEPATGNDDLQTKYDKIVADAKELNVDLIRIGMLPFDKMRSLDTVLEFCREANDYAIKLRDEHGIKLYYHNHHVEFIKYDGKFMWDIIADECPDLGFEVDVHWVQRAGVYPVDLLKQYKGRVDLVHLKDYRVGKLPEEAFTSLDAGDVATFYTAFTNNIEFAELGKGSMNFPPIIEAALDAGARYLLVEQDMLYGRDPIDCLRDSRDHLVEIGYEHLFNRA